MKINPSQTINNLGGKGYQLALLKEFCLVPEYFVIYFEKEDEIGIIEVQEEIIRIFDSYMFEYVSVRSSATVEDSYGASFAGIFKTKLNVTRENLLESIREILESSKNKRVLEYCNYNGIKASSIQMRVVVQKMVNSKVAGVCLTKQTDNPDMILIEACWGLGELLVSGMSMPDIYKVNRNNFEIEVVSIGYQKEKIAPFRPNEIQIVPFHLRNSKKLKDTEIIELAKMCLSIERNLEYLAADIEWAFDKDTLYTLQARPYICKARIDSSKILQTQNKGENVCTEYRRT